jgi:YidC/Oxa1 family membrane protein insertase
LTFSGGEIFLAFFDFIINSMSSLLNFCYQFTVSIGCANYGVAIILLTLFIKIILYPLTVKQIKSIQAMQELQPKMKAIQEKYKGKPEKLSEELKKLYANAGVNPLAGCLPLLVQMPILIAIFYAIRDYHYLQTPPAFLWIPDLSQSDATFILPIVSGLTTYFQQKQTATEQTANNKILMYGMPVFIGYISLNFPSGLVLYWVMSNLAQIFQQWYMYRKAAA